MISPKRGPLTLMAVSISESVDVQIGGVKGLGDRQVAVHL